MWQLKDINLLLGKRAPSAAHFCNPIQLFSFAHFDAKKHKDWTLDQWKYVLWSDESKFAIFGSNRRVLVRRREGERMVSACVVPTVKHGGGSVMAWGGFAGDAVGDLF